MAGKKIFLLAGESSGDRLGAGLMQALVRQHGAQQFHGVGGAAMQAQGLRSVFPMQEIALMGLRQIVPRLPHLLSRLRTLSDE
ncbi:MAG: lipid-A-disaccharide synthase, partial [Hyphomicrobiales bacterium]|nr:lipid-A-disaccharide synthase [Hyphomicrobiales bacterium]